MLVLDQAAVTDLLDPEALIDALAPAMVALSQGAVSLPPRIGVQVKDYQGLLASMPVYLPAMGLLVCKLVSVYPGNAARGLHTHNASIQVFEAATGLPVAFMDGGAITAERTAREAAIVLMKDDFIAATKAREKADEVFKAEMLRKMAAVERDLEIETKNRVFAFFDNDHVRQGKTGPCKRLYVIATDDAARTAADAAQAEREIASRAREKAAAVRATAEAAREVADNDASEAAAAASDAAAAAELAQENAKASAIAEAKAKDEEAVAREEEAKAVSLESAAVGSHKRAVDARATAVSPA